MKSTAGNKALVKRVYIQCVRILLFALIASSAVFPQTVDQMKNRYGSSVSETFTVRTGVGVRVRSRPNGAIAEMLIFPMRAGSLIESRNASFSYQTAKNLLDELVPASRRGKFIIGGFVDGICEPEDDCAGSSEDYENISIYYNSAAEPGKLCYVDVHFKK